MKKLQLNKEVIAQLGNSRMDQVRGGGYTDENFHSCDFTCLYVYGCAYTNNEICDQFTVDCAGYSVYEGCDEYETRMCK